MNSAILALATRTLNSSAKHLGWHLAIWGIAVLTLAALLRVFLYQQRFTASGLEFMQWSVELNLLATTLAGIGLFATRITAEREAGTLDLLRLAGLGSAGIIVTLWLPLLISCSMLLIVQVPFAMFAVTLGGITPSQVVAVYVTMCLHLFFVSSIGLWASVHCRTSAGAVLLTAVLLALWCFGARSIQPILIIIGGFSRSINGLTLAIYELLEPYRSISGFNRVSQILSFRNLRPVWWDWPDLWQIGLGCIAILWAWASIEFQASRDGRVLWRRSIPRIRRLRSWKNSIVWKEFIFLTGGWRGMAIRAVLYPLVGITFSDGWKLERMYEPGIRMLGWDGAILMAQVFSREFRDETWDTLRLVPLTLRQLCYRKVVGVALALVPGVIWMLITKHHWKFYFGGIEHFFFCTLVLFSWCVTAFVSIILYRFTWSIAFLIGLVSATAELQLVDSFMILRRYPQLTLFLMSILNLITCIILSQLTRIRIRYLSE